MDVRASGRESDQIRQGARASQREHGLRYSNIYVTIPPSSGSESPSIPISRLFDLAISRSPDLPTSRSPDLTGVSLYHPSLITGFASLLCAHPRPGPPRQQTRTAGGMRDNLRPALNRLPIRRAIASGYCESSSRCGRWAGTSSLLHLFCCPRVCSRPPCLMKRRNSRACPRSRPPSRRC